MDRSKLLNGAAPAVNAAASAKPVDQNAARKAAAAALTASTGLDSLAAYSGVGVVMGSMAKSGLITVAATELAQIGEVLNAMKWALSQAYVMISEIESANADEAESRELMLSAIETVLGGKPHRVQHADA